MKHPLFALVGLGLLLAAASACAQTGAVKANVPFDFVVERAELPAGQYVIQNAGIDGSFMTIQSKDRKVLKAVIPDACQSNQSQTRTKLIFHRYGDRYFLAQIWTAGNDRGRELQMSKRETEAARNHPVEDVVVVATLR
jgi:hypothetical protein